MLSSPGNAFDHFWKLEKWIQWDKKHLGVVLELDKSEITWDIAALMKKKVIKMEALDGFGDWLIAAVNRLLGI